MLLAALAARLEEVAATSSRREKAEVLAGLLRQAGPAELPVLVRYLEGELPQRRTGLGWRSLAGGPPPAASATLEVLDVDAAMAAAAAEQGPGSTGRRRGHLLDLMGRATAAEQHLVAGLVSGELRQGAQRGVLVEALAGAAEVPAAVVRRALTLSGDVVEVAVAALGADGPAPARAALEAVRLEVGRPVSPMLAASAPDVAAALARTGAAVVEWKLDGVRVQVHRDEGPGGAPRVRVWTRTLEEVTGSLPEVVAAVAALPARTLVLDGEVLLLRPADDDGPADGTPAWQRRRPAPFQETSSRVATRGARAVAVAAAEDAGQDGAEDAPADGASPAPDAPGPTVRTSGVAEGGGDAPPPLQLVLFDVLHRDGEDLLDAPLRRRREVLLDLAPHLAVPGAAAAPRTDVDGDDDPSAPATALAREALARGHEGVVVKGAGSPYAAGRRGAAWVKVKPRLTLDLVVLAVERGSGRRRGLLSNLWLGARDPEGRFGPPGGGVMLGKTFKGLTDEMLAWQTERLGALAVPDADGREDGYVVHVRPELVVEIALDGVQTSPRYPAGLALRFARVVAHRPDKPAAEADTVAAVEALHAAARGLPDPGRGPDEA